MRRALLGIFALLAASSLSACGGTDPYAGMPDPVKKRHLALEGAPNFRDLGGYETSDGRHVKWGEIYRSDNLAHLTDSDLAKVSGLGIRLVCEDVNLDLPAIMASQQRYEILHQDMIAEMR